MNLPAVRDPYYSKETGIQKIGHPATRQRQQVNIAPGESEQAEPAVDHKTLQELSRERRNKDAPGRVWDEQKQRGGKNTHCVLQPVS